VATVREILETKGSHVLTIGTDAQVLDAALVMNEHKVGALVVTTDGRPVGMFSERDVLQRVVAAGRDPTTTTVAEVMTIELICCRLETTLEEARTAMKHRRIRHLPVVGADGELAGLISIGDLNAYYAHSQDKTIQFMHDYLYGRV